MRVAVVSDIHANLHALSAVLAAVDEEAPDAIWCLGDLVGYGPRPNACVTAVCERAAICLAGNHDLGVLGSVPIEAFSGEAGAAAVWTREVLRPEARDLLERLEPQAQSGDPAAELYHASPRDPVWEYVIDVPTVEAAFAATSAPLVLVGHSHVPIEAQLAPALSASVAHSGTEVDLARGRTLLNPGSVGQPRDGDCRAAWLLLDFGRGTASFRRTDYAIARTQEEMEERGLPEVLAERLGHGL